MNQYRISVILHDGARFYVRDWYGRPPWSLTSDRRLAGFFSWRQARELGSYGTASGLDVEIEEVCIHQRGSTMQ